MLLVSKMAAVRDGGLFYPVRLVYIYALDSKPLVCWVLVLKNNQWWPTSFLQLLYLCADLSLAYVSQNEANSKVISFSSDVQYFYVYDERNNYTFIKLSLVVEQSTGL